MTLKSSKDELHPKLWQIVDLNLYKTLFDSKQQIDDHIAAAKQGLEAFFKTTGIDEKYFAQKLAPNVSTEVYTDFVNLNHQYKYMIPTVEYINNYISLTLDVNEMLFKHDFDDCVDYFEAEDRKATIKRRTRESASATYLALTKFGLQNHKRLRRESEDYAMSDADRKQISEYTGQYLKTDYGWTDDAIIKELRT